MINGYLDDRGGCLFEKGPSQVPHRSTGRVRSRIRTANAPRKCVEKKGNQYDFGMKTHIGVYAESSLVHNVVDSVANMSDVTQVDRLLHDEERRCMPTLATPGRKSGPSPRETKSSGRLRRAQHLQEARKTQPAIPNEAQDQEPKRRRAPNSSTRFG